MEKRELLELLVGNALDFLTRSVSDLKTTPKSSVINFYSAVELFVKARLLHEHWTLIVSSRHTADYDKFLKGDFVSVTLDEAADRLEKAVKSGLTDQEFKAFQQVAKHRNKMVHFFHEAHSTETNGTTSPRIEGLRQAVVKEQLNAWYLLHRLLTTRWQGVFSSWSAEIAKVDALLRTHHEYLRAAYNNQRSEISEREKQGCVIEECPSCHFQSFVYEPDLGVLYDAECVVCGASEKCIAVQCKKCKKNVRFITEGYTTCDCGCQMEPDDLVSALFELDAAEAPMRDDDHSPHEAGNCGSCEGFHTVVEMPDGGCFCACCFESFDEISQCEWCNEPNTGDMDDSYWRGCSACDGKAGWDSDKDD